MRKNVIISAFLLMALMTGFAATLATQGGGEPTGLVVGQDDNTTVQEGQKAQEGQQAQDGQEAQEGKKEDGGKQGETKPLTTSPNNGGPQNRHNPAPTQPLPNNNPKEMFNNGGVGDNGTNEGNTPEANGNTATTADYYNTGGQQSDNGQAATNTEDSNNDNISSFYDEEEESQSLLWWVVIGLIVLGGLVYWKFVRHQKPYELSTNGKSGHNRDRTSNSRDRRNARNSDASPRDNAVNDIRMARLEERVQALENTISSLNSKIDAFSNRLNNDWGNNPDGKYPNPPNPVQPVPSPNAHQTIYCSQVHSNIFVQSGHSAKGTQNTICVITAKGDSGEYELYNDPSAQQRMIATYMSSIAPVADVRSKTQTATRIDTVKKGRVRRQGDDWVITEKAIVELK